MNLSKHSPAWGTLGKNGPLFLGILIDFLCIFLFLFLFILWNSTLANFYRKCEESECVISYFKITILAFSVSADDLDLPPPRIIHLACPCRLFLADVKRERERKKKTPDICWHDILQSNRQDRWTPSEKARPLLSWSPPGRHEIRCLYLNGEIVW